MRKTLAHDIRMQKNPQTKEDIYEFSWSYTGPKSNLHTLTEISSMASPTVKLSICYYFFKYFELTDFFVFFFKKTLTLNESKKKDEHNM